MTGSTGIPDEIVVRLRSVCLGLPEAYEEPAWVGTRWRIRGRTFAHVLVVESGWPPVYARALGSDGPATVLTFRLPLAELDALVGVGHPYFVARWGRDVCGMTLDTDVDWDEISEHLTESYCLMAPRKLVDQVDRPGG